MAKNGIAALIVDKAAKPPEGMEETAESVLPGDDAPSDDEISAATDAISAFEAKDPVALAHALRAFCGLTSVGAETDDPALG